MKVKKSPHLHVDWIDGDALEIVEDLQDAGFKAYLVGGCVRDLLAGFHPKDFDIATDARPEEIKDVIRRAYIIGRRFRLVLVRRGEKQFEVATFRRDPKPSELEGEETPFGDNIFGSPEEDSRRRDFTINAMFFDPVKEELIDFVEGQKDIDDGIMRIIGDPETRLKEDPIRILRSLRLAHKLKFTIEPGLRAAMLANASELSRSVLPRKREEILKILRLKDPSRTLHEAHDLGILKFVCPEMDELFNHPENLEEFDQYIRRFHDFVDDTNSPVELFGGLILAWHRATMSRDPHSVPPPQDFLNDPKIKNFFRDQLGMSNLEQSLVSWALYLQSTLKDVERMRRKGNRRLMGVLRHDSFKLAMLFAKADHVLSPSEIQFWVKAYQDAAHIIEQEKEPRDGPRRPRRGFRRNRRRDRPQKAEPVPSKGDGA